MKSSPTASHRTLGLLADWFDERYQQAILNTVEEATAQRAANLLAFAGGIPGSNERKSSLRHLAFEMVGSTNVDGAILLAGTMVNELGPEALAELLSQLRGMPLCSIGVELPGVPSIVVDNQAGIKRAVQHLVEHHQCRSVGFIRGPAKNKEAESRFVAFQTALEQARVELKKELIFQGNFLRATGEAAVANWLSEKLQPDAIICANDEMAFGALHALLSAGVRVPEDVRIVGFDDLEVARLASPPLTTVRQPLTELAVTAVRTVMDQIHGREVPAVQTLQTHLVIRESCGCTLRLTSTGQSQFAEEKSAPIEGDFASEFAQCQQPLQAELVRAARGEFMSLGRWESALLRAFAQQATSESSEFVQTLGQFVSKVANQGGDVSRFQDVITAFRRFALPCCGEDHVLRTHVENILQEARLVTAHATERAQAGRRMELESFMRTLADVGAALTSSFDLAGLADVVCDELPRLGVTACYLSVYEPFDAPGPGSKLPERARLIAAYDSLSGLRRTTPSEDEFATSDLRPPTLGTPSRTQQMITLPLFLKGRSLGFCLLECKGAKGSVLEVLREQLSIALFGCLLAVRYSEIPRI